ncbi:MAG: restriction endonuclease [Oscillibacter sp.]|nr:restriction endonuclease [Oscillibacter sp.]
MAVPKYNQLYLPVLQALSDGKTHTNHEIAEAVADAIPLSAEDRRETTPSGKPLYFDRVSWAKVYLKKAGLIEAEARGRHRLTAEGASVLAHLPPILDNTFLAQYPSFREFYHPNSASPEAALPANPDETPSDLIQQSFEAMNRKLADDLLAEIMAKDPSFFEALVVKLLLKMGYGGSASDSGFVTQKTNDGGIDGIIREDKLGFDQIYIQAKRWDPTASISRPEIQKFSGALQEVKASKGLFITTANFSDGARASAEKQHIVLVDGTRLTRLMIEYNVGVSPIAKYEIKEIDSDFFNEGEE